MSFNGSGTYNLPAGQPVVTGTVISSTTFNTLTSDLATALTLCITKDGQSTTTGRIPFLFGVSSTLTTDATSTTTGSIISAGGISMQKALWVGTSATIGTQSTTQGSIVLANTAASAYPTTLKSSNSATAAWALTLPTSAGTSGHVLTTDGTGVTSWADSATVYPGAGVANSTGSAWGTSYSVSGTGTVLAATVSPTFTTPALGTPSSGVVTNLTGTASININGTVGATTPTTGAFTTVTASGNVTPTSGGLTLGTSSLPWATVYGEALSDETDQLVGSSGTTVRFGYGAGWTALAFATGGAERMRLNSSGNMLFGATSGTAARIYVKYAGSSSDGIDLSDSDNANNSAYVVFRNNANTAIGEISRAGSTDAILYVTTSDYRRKNNPQALTGSGAFIDALKPKTWAWKSDGSKGVGFIAHEFAEVSPSSVSGEKDAVDENGEPKYQGMQASSSEVIANLVAEIQSLRARIAKLEGV